MANILVADLGVRLRAFGATADSLRQMQRSRWGWQTTGLASREGWWPQIVPVGTSSCHGPRN
jgi:hypothetical protein